MGARAEQGGTAVYHEGSNIYVYIRGDEDDAGDWWKAGKFHETRRNEKGLTLVNAHLDSWVKPVVVVPHAVRHMS